MWTVKSQCKLYTAYRVAGFSEASETLLMLKMVAGLGQAGGHQTPMSPNAIPCICVSDCSVGNRFYSKFICFVSLNSR